MAVGSSKTIGISPRPADDAKIVLLGDVGGTKALLQIVAMNGAEVRVLCEQRFACRHYDNFLDLLGEFLRQEARLGTPDVACMGIAGPVSRQVVKVTNLPWEIQAKQISAKFGIPRVRLLNDFEALAHGIDTLTEADILEPSEAFRHAMDYFAHAPNTDALLETLAQTQPRTLACMHGSAWRGDGATLLRGLAASLRH